MDYLAQQIINGLQLGFVYALIALGYTMVYGIVRLINFAHGDVFMVGAFLGYWGMGVVKIGIIPSFLISMLGCAILGILIERIAYKPLRMAPRIAALITALGVSLFLEYFCSLKFVFGPDYRQFPRPFELVTWQIGAISITNITLIIIGVAVALMLILQYVVHRTKLGLAMRSVTYDHDTARLMGINVDMVISLTFGIGSALAAAGGILYGIAYPQINSFMGMMPGLKAFVAAVLGGIGLIPGAMIGALIMGQAETLTSAYLSSTLRDAVAFAILIIVLIIKPSGILGKRSTEKV
jgi:branched-chain amino acid transport system permease protein